MLEHSDNRPIGVFDSGLGGLTVAAALQKRLPNESVVYLGDTARVPYGDKSVDSIITYARQDVAFMRSRGVKLIVAACNTVSAVALEQLHRDNPTEAILGVIESGVTAAVSAGARSITVIGTRATINSDAYRRALHKLDHALRVESIACPLFVPLAEEGITSGALVAGVFDVYLKHVKENPPDALLLGCTHYPLFQNALREYFDNRTRIIDSAGACAEAVQKYLTDHQIAAHAENHATAGYFVTDLPSEFNRHAIRFLGQLPARVEKVKLTGE